jgi:hypothetical protein
VKVYRQISDTAMWPNSATTGNLLNSLSAIDPTFNTYALGVQLPWLYGVGGTQPMVAVNEDNANPHFEVDISNWSNTSTCVLTQSAAQAYTGTSSMFVTPGVAPVAASVESDQQPAISGRSYQASVWVFSTTGNKQFSIGIRWYQSGVLFLTSSTTPVTISAGRWVPLTITATAPIGVTAKSMVVTNSGAGLLNTDTFYLDAAFLGESVLHCVQWSTGAGTTAQGVEIQVPCRVGAQYTTSVYVRQSSASTQQMSVPALGVTGTSTAATGQGFTRLSVTFTATLPYHAVRIATTGAALAGTVELDDAQHEAAAIASPFQPWGATVGANLINALSGFNVNLSYVYAGFDPSFETYVTAGATNAVALVVRTSVAAPPAPTFGWPGAVGTYAYVVDSPIR